MIGGKIAGEIAAEAIRTNNYKLLDNYRDKWMKERGKSHTIFERLSEIFNLSDEELNEKFVELTSPVLGTHSTDKLLKHLWLLDQIDLSACLAYAVQPE